MKKISINGIWQCIPDYEDEGLDLKWYISNNVIKHGLDLLEIEIPTSHNCLPGFEVYEGIFWHFCDFRVDKKNLNEAGQLALNIICE